ncbi:MAG TPA: hypothetical protein VNN08_18170 [Thermoanaerobaculia bacterium]|nr:hypothetical protein [Thermoanaerobaculia bacterium]
MRTASLATHSAKPLNRPRTVSIELPEFAMVALEHPVEMMNPSARFARSRAGLRGAE